MYVNCLCTSVFSRQVKWSGIRRSKIIKLDIFGHIATLWAKSNDFNQRRRCKTTIISGKAA
jgi:hypothetical protein